MVQFCSKCDKEVPASAAFCSACGTAVVTDASAQSSAGTQAAPGYTPVNVPGQTVYAGPQTFAGAPPSSGFTPVPPPPPAAGYAHASGAYSGPTAARQKSGSGALKIVLIAVLVGLGIVGSWAVGFLVWRVLQPVGLPRSTMTTSLTTFVTAEELGTEIYPGAQSTTGGGRMSVAEVSVVTGVYLTSDSRDQVVSFYKSKLGSGASVYEFAQTATLSLRKGSRESIEIAIEAKPEENSGKTKISIVHTTHRHDN
jgi:hypothetical protein